MLEWTGERFLPWLKESTIAYEHLHRYAYAATFVKDKRVLDLASGEGYGSKMMAQAASSVVGIDIDEDAVRHATVKYGSTTLQFIPGSITSVPIREDHSFDAVVCFEAIEHIEDQETLLSEVERLLKPDGLFMVSTPNKTEYHHEADENNPFHVKELEFDEFRQLLARHFKSLRFLGQRILPSSSIWPIGAANGAGFEEFVMERGETEFRFIGNEKRTPLYFIALASNSPLPLPQPGSVLLDHSNSLVEEKDQEIQATRKEVQWREQQIGERTEQIKSLEGAIKWEEQKIRDRDETIRSLEDAVAWKQQHIRDRDLTIRSLEETIRSQGATILSQEEALKWEQQQISDRDGAITSLEQGLEWRKGQVEELEKTIAAREEGLKWRAAQVEELQNEKAALISESSAVISDLQATLQSTQQQFTTAMEQLEGILASRGWKFVRRVRHINERLRKLLGLTG